MRAIVSSRAVVRGSVLVAEDFESAQIPASQCPKDAIDDTSVAEGRTPIKRIRKGELIRLGDLGIKMLPKSPARTIYTGKADIPLPVVIAARKILKGSTIKYQDIRIKKVLFSKVPPHSLVSPYSAVSRRVRSEIAEGQILFLNDVGLER